MRLIIVLLFILASIPAYAQSWGGVGKANDGAGFFSGGNNTQVIVNKDREREVAEAKSQNGGLSENEATWNIDIEGLAYIMPDQPVPDQMLSTMTGYGTTYKFSDKMQVVGKWMQFDIEGKKGVKWHHSHMLMGIGFRDLFAGNQSWQINLLTGESKVTGNKGIGEISNLELPMFLDIKYMWVLGPNIMIGPQITFGRVPNSCEEPDGKYSDCGHGGYSAMSFAIQVGLPENWGN